MERAMRLDKLLTELGTGSRSEVKKYIRSGLVTVNGEVVKKPEQKVDEKKDTVCFRGNPLTYTCLLYTSPSPRDCS